MGTRILLLQGHPDANGARAAGHELRELVIASLDFPLLRSAQSWQHGALPESLWPAQEAIAWAQHLAVFFPLWLGGMPALLKGFLEQVARPGFALAAEGAAGPKKLLAGRSARIVVTMGMPALMYRFLFRAHSVKALERNIFGSVGIAPVHETLIGRVEDDAAGRARWFERLRVLGGDAA